MIKQVVYGVSLVSLTFAAADQLEGGCFQKGVIQADKFLDGEERNTLVADDAKMSSVKKFMEEEIISEQDQIKQTSTSADIDAKELDSKCVKKNCNQMGKTSKGSCDIHCEVDEAENLGPEICCHQDLWEKTLKNLDMELVMNKLCQQIYPKSANPDNKSDAYSLSDEKLVEAIKVFVDQRLTDEKYPNVDEKIDQNSNSFARANLLDSGLKKSKPSELVAPKKHNFFRRKRKSKEKVIFKGIEKCQTSKRIIILKSGLASVHTSKSEAKPTERTTSKFSFIGIKRKLKNAMRKERRGIPSDDITHIVHCDHQKSNSDEVIGEEKGGWNSPNQNHFYIERFARLANGIKSRHKSCKPKDSENKTVECSKLKLYNSIYIEAKKHLSEMMSNGAEIREVSSRQVPKALGRILSLSEQSCNSNSDVSDELNHGNAMEEALCSAKPEKSSEGDVEIVATTDSLVEEESSILDISAEQCSSAVIRGDQKGNLPEVFHEDEYTQCFKLDLIEQDQLLCSPLTSPPRCSITNHGDVNSAHEIPDKPSPVSVLEPLLFTKDDICPASIKSKPVTPPMQPQQIHFEELPSCATNHEFFVSDYCMDDEESAFEYVEAVLLASDLNWEEFLLRWLSSYQILDPSLFDEVELFSSRSCQDQKLLFDCTNEVLKEICELYFGYSPRVSFVKRKIRPIPRGKELIHEVWEEVEWHLLPQPYPHTLEQLIRKDMSRTGTWMDVRSDVESVEIEIGEAIFEELMEDAISSFENEGPGTDSSLLLGETIEK
ncbi:hypothetical protein U1Q18_023589 [Sarracenia purpurea var. burkii]